ncbi:MAG: hypothetical protein GXO87_14990 [Chlorobi bacterium]|nr:hypothetical protein [Chlorobiota bacterium]
MSVVANEAIRRNRKNNAPRCGYISSYFLRGVADCPPCPADRLLPTSSESQ